MKFRLRLFPDQNNKKDKFSAVMHATINNAENSENSFDIKRYTDQFLQHVTVQDREMNYSVMVQSLRSMTSVYSQNCV